jgi:hypothetical protein
MDEFKGSAGPWEYHPNRCGWTVTTGGPDGWEIATLVVYSTGDPLMPDAVQHANGRLLAAAPCLLAAAQLTLRTMDLAKRLRAGGPVNPLELAADRSRAEEALRAALAKATGTPSTSG